MKALKVAAAMLLIACGHAVAAPVEAGPAPANWGIYGALAGGAWLSKGSNGSVSLIEYAWRGDGGALVAHHRSLGNGTETFETITPGAVADRLNIATATKGEEPSISDVLLRADGAAVETWTGRDGRPQRATYVLADPDRYVATTERLVDGEWREFWRSEIVRVEVEETPAPEAAPVDDALVFTPEIARRAATAAPRA